MAGSTLPVGSSAESRSRPGDYGAGDGEPLLLAAGQGRRQGVRPVRQPDPGQHLLDVGGIVGAFPADAQRQGGVVEDD